MQHWISQQQNCAQILKSKSLMELQNQLINRCDITPSNEDIININLHIKTTMRSKFNKQGAICFRGGKTAAVRRYLSLLNQAWGVSFKP